MHPACISVAVAGIAVDCALYSLTCHITTYVRMCVCIAYTCDARMSVFVYTVSLFHC